MPEDKRESDDRDEKREALERTPQMKGNKGPAILDREPMFLAEERKRLVREFRRRLE